MRELGPRARDVVSQRQRGDARVSDGWWSSSPADGTSIDPSCWGLELRENRDIWV